MCVCFKAVTFIVINLELLPYNSSTLLTFKKYHGLQSGWRLQKPFILWCFDALDLYFLLPLYGDQITARKIYIDRPSIFQGFTLLENVLFCIDAYGVKTVWQSSKNQFLENFDCFSSFFVFNATRQFIVGHYERRASAQF